MGELTLVGLHEDGEHVVLEGSDGQRFRLRIDEALRAAVRRDRAQLEQLRADRAGALPPREIQARIRAGAPAEDVAADAGMPVELVRRYEGPVLAEREFVAGQARATRIGHDPGAPVLGELVTDRLATRGVGAESIAWDAFRPGTGSWTVEVRFEVSGTARSARWTYDAATRSVRAQDDEARWLSETELHDGPIPRRHLSAVPGADVDVDAALRPLLASVDLPPAPEPEPEPDPAAETAALLDDLTGRRGVRQPLEVEHDDEDEGFEGFGPQHAFDFDNPDLTIPAAHPPHSRPDLATDAQVLEMPAQPRRSTTEDDVSAQASPPAAEDEPIAPAEPEKPAEERVAGGGRSRARRGRASVPSWDEIVFGARPE
ncbi:septation protein SepH [Actinotalea sp. AC32]|nr:septation protein SepH [Actinotalea sp. AC32]